MDICLAIAIFAAALVTLTSPVDSRSNVCSSCALSAQAVGPAPHETATQFGLGVAQNTPVVDADAANVVSEPDNKLLFPPNDGFLGPLAKSTLEIGQIIDRYGGTEVARFFSPQGTLVEARALPPTVAQQPLRTFRVLRAFEVETGTVAPWYGQRGLGTQFRSPMPLVELLEQGYILELAK